MTEQTDNISLTLSSNVKHLHEVPGFIKSISKQHTVRIALG